MVLIKKSIAFLVIVSITITAYFYNEHNKLEAYDQFVIDYTKITDTDADETEKLNFLNTISDKIADYPNEIKWQKLYATAQIKFFQNYNEAINTMENIYQKTLDNHTLIGICIFKEKIEKFDRNCYEKVLQNISQPYYNDMNYWIATHQLGNTYDEKDIKKSNLPNETILMLMAQDKQYLLNSLY